MSENNNQNINDSNSCNQTLMPTWIQSTLFEGLLKDLYNDFEKIEEFKVDNALAPGENYATLMLKVEIIMKLKDGFTKPISFMLKVAHDSEIFREFMKNHNVFDVEAKMYQSFVPEFEQLYLDAGVDVKFAAKSYPLATDEHYILLENLKERGFKNVNRLDGLDMVHTRNVLKKLAQFHAASAVRVTKKGVYPREICTSFFKPEGYEIIKNMFENNTKILLECVKEYSNSEQYYEKVVKIQNQLTDELYKLIDIDPNEFNVLNHGDCWSNNIMFKHDEQGNVAETYLIDYQMPRYSSPAEDLFYFLLSSTQLDIKLCKFDYFIKYYHDNLVESLQLLKYCKPMPSLKDLHIMLYKYGIFGYMTCTNVMAAVLCDPCDNANLENFVQETEEGNEFKRQMYTNDRYRKHIEAILPWLLNKGLLDC